MALVLNAFRSPSREETYAKLSDVLEERPSCTLSALSYDEESPCEERFAEEEAALAAYAPCLVGLLLRDLRDASEASSTRRRSAVALLASVYRVAVCRADLSRSLVGAGLTASAASRAALNCAGAALRYGDGVALAKALEIRARMCGGGGA